ncbi:DUF2834 domain-containing protein [Microbacterium rhizomatis]|uniref:DUF2834 domain-containing protein n=1 Tax=Microbacterium rhizomatis TaxID=1631477 RepID=A0A5J5IZF2_9MICO|nr:DUF2834 domain-containing protein [Microbacterium rhizomatis]KAA9105031.1 DUF2834 domain-containing protein [Microbacterium rhizomatis]
MTRHWTPLAFVYLGLAVVGLIGTMAFNVLSVVLMRDYLGDLFGGGPAVTSISIDLLVAAIAASIFVIVESRRLGMRFGWLYIVAAGVTAFAFTFPLFLAMRQRRMTERRMTERAAPRE